MPLKQSQQQTLSAALFNIGCIRYHYRLLFKVYEAQYR